MDLNQLHWAWQTLIAALLVIGGLFTLIGAIGMLRFKDFYMRLHAPTKATTLGVGGVLLASMCLHWAQDAWVLNELLIAVFLFVTAPVSANLLAKAALHLRVPSKAPVPPQQPQP
jgi:multicomponent K+:H+ antiporter subunit G